MNTVRIVRRSDTGEKTDVEFLRNYTESQICRPADHLRLNRFVPSVFEADFADASSQKRKFRFERENLVMQIQPRIKFPEFGTLSGIGINRVRIDEFVVRRNDI